MTQPSASGQRRISSSWPASASSVDLAIWSDVGRFRRTTFGRTSRPPGSGQRIPHGHRQFEHRSLHCAAPGSDPPRRTLDGLAVGVAVTVPGADQVQGARGRAVGGLRGERRPRPGVPTSLAVLVAPPTPRSDVLGTALLGDRAARPGWDFVFGFHVGRERAHFRIRRRRRGPGVPRAPDQAGLHRRSTPVRSPSRS